MGSDGSPGWTRGGPDRPCDHLRWDPTAHLGGPEVDRIDHQIDRLRWHPTAHLGRPEVGQQAGLVRAPPWRRHHRPAQCVDHGRAGLHLLRRQLEP
eukprot:5523273-Pyramimonas_sp.AAC.1